jgi:hypothetical protein
MCNKEEAMSNRAMEQKCARRVLPVYDVIDAGFVWYETVLARSGRSRGKVT